ncbi:hypothetical protein LR48_Vigan02g174600 [Vigna angularis]|uniref:Protein YLS7 Protein TRICHOME BIREFRINGENCE-LIKE 17 Protein YELLOW-LEAF-SPECIFIC GENE 7 n=2 Tax=Phaseolus angularis TaxID=3914 RepID=A0A0L9TYL4_PHAAN|nr:protein YLS7 [Vigna angularis]KAG2402106.1 Protein YLS7 Protein TRICHOME BIREFRINGENCE-LIKE 17 Protein YELLOW-LEAF-SPECIFIC GENE 7 [Vigna angularis]KOM35596.1 hypothetical protein LR48_Vigan02g174600 [Vigna angularis]BAT94821.1 hypothetical protein VIGAN_08146400 [Vigna angularis var. angularis]
MAWTALKGSPRASSHPRPLSWIVVIVGALAVFLFCASWVLVSSPIGSRVQGYFYSVSSSEKLDLPVSPLNEYSIDDGHWNTSLDHVNDKPPSEDLQSSSISNDVSNDSKIDQTNTKANSQVDLGQSTPMNVPMNKEVNKDPAVSSSGEPVTTVGDSADVSNSILPSQESADVANSGLPAQESADASNSGLPAQESVDIANSGLPAQENSQIDSNSSKTMPLAGSNSSNETGNIRMEEPASVASINQSTVVSTASNETSPSSDDSTSTAVPASVEKPESTSSAGCDLYHGHWIHDPLGPLYTNNSCPVLTQMQNCQGNGRPDKDYENWRWKPSQCDLPRFDPKKFLELMRGKTLAFIGDSVARNQMESMLCILWQVETPKNRGNHNMQRYYFRSTSFMIVRIWSSWLVKLTTEPFDYAPAGVDKLHLDAPDEKLMEHIPNFDVVVLSSGHWFAKKSVYILNNEIVGGQLWWPDKSREMKVDSVKAYGISVETILTAIATIPNYKGLTIVRSYSPDHYEGGAWNTGGSCTGKVKPLAPGEGVENLHTNIMHEQQVTGFKRALEKSTDGSKLRLMDITEAFQFRHDGHPGPYRSPDPNKITKRGPDGRPPPQDCLHWCMPGPVDTWNELVFEIIRREFEGGSAS